MCDFCQGVGCSICTAWCYRCNCKMKAEDAVVYNSRNNFCKRCAKIFLETCCVCHNIKEKNDYCTFCLNEQRVIKDYSYRPAPVFKKITNQKDNTYFGVELEIAPEASLYGKEENKINFSSEIQNKFKKFIYCKYDCSLPTGGVEIVSQPATYQYHMKKCWSDIFESMKKYKMNNTNQCGLHFHVNRSALNTETIKILDLFINAMENSAFIAEQGGRRLEGYCHRNIKRPDRWGCASCRTDAFNTTNPVTVEFRFCKATYQYDDFIKKLTFIKNLIEFAKKTKFEEVLYTRDKVKMFKNIIK